MASEDEDTLTAVLDRDQRSFRRVLFASIAMIVVVVLLGALLAAQNLQASGKLAKMARDLAEANQNIRDVEQRARLEAHRLREAADNAAIADSRRAMENRAAFEDIRDLIEASSPNAGGAATLESAVNAATAYLQGRRLPLVGERAIQTVLAEGGGLDGSTRDLLIAVEQMRRFDKTGADLRVNADGRAALTPELEDAAARLDNADDAPNLRQAAVLGRARIDYVLASANAHERALCEAMFRRGDRIPRAAWSIQLLLNRAACWRKNGDSQNAYNEFNGAVRRLAGVEPRADQALTGSDADPLVQYQAYHGRGTALIAIAGGANEGATLLTAQNDLKKAVDLRKLGGQSELEVVGSLENLGLAYLRAGDYRAAAANAASVARVRTLNWNETVRAIAAGELGEADEAHDAQLNLRNYRRAEFNECELKRLVGTRNEAALTALLAQTRDSGRAPACPVTPAVAAATAARKKS
jgi:hypothetical protein